MNFLATPFRRRLLFAFLYFSEGAPIGFLWFYLPARLKAQGVGEAEIGALAAWLVLPWSLKFLWAPAVDILRSSRWTLRHWIMASQAAMGAALAPMCVFDVAVEQEWLFPLLIAHALAAATQDVSIDALAVSTLSAPERGRANGWMQMGLLVGRGLFGGAALMLGALLGDRGVVALLLVAVWSSMALVALAREPSDVEPAAGETARRQLARFLGALAAVFSQRTTWLGLAFAAVAGAAYEGAAFFRGPLLLEQQVSEQQLGLFNLAGWLPAMAAGALVGGWLADRIGHRWAVMAAMLGFVAAVAALALACLGDAQIAYKFAALVALAAFVGAFTASSYALFMDITRPEIAATQFSAFMGGTNVCEAWSTAVTGQLVAAAGYPIALLTMCAPTLAAVPIAGLLAGRARKNQVQNAFEPSVTARR